MARISCLWRCSLVVLAWASLLASAQSRLGPREIPPLSDDQIRTLVSSVDPLDNLDPSNPMSHLSKILIPRAPESTNNTLVREYIVSTLKALDWHIERDGFSAMTPIGMKRFMNIIATKDPKASRRVVLAAHFDSKYYPTFPNNQFVGATDSAAPCAMMLDLAETLNKLLEERQKRLEAGLEEDEDISDVTLQLVFFDGEEAFGDWSDTDSIYGARHLAEKWDTTYISPHSKRRLLRTETELSTVENFILLDLLGAANPYIRNYFIDTAWLFDAMESAEHRLNNVDLAVQSVKSFFVTRKGVARNYGGIGDDHLPFLKRGVSVLHVISNPFPSVWHTIHDDAKALHMPSARKWNLILRVFMAEYLGLQPEGQKKSSHSRSESELVR